MGLRRFRHPALTLTGVGFFLFMSVSDALGMKQCVHHGGHDPDAHAALGQTAEVSTQSEGHGSHAHHADHGEGHGAPTPSSEDGHGEQPHDQGCDCGIRCVGMSGPAPVQAGLVSTFKDSTTPGEVLGHVIATDDVAPACRVPHLLPFPNGPPAPAR